MDSCADGMQRNIVRVNNALLTIGCNAPSLGVGATGATVRRMLFLESNSAGNFFAQMFSGCGNHLNCGVAAK